MDGVWCLNVLQGIFAGNYDINHRRRRQFYLRTMKQFGLGDRRMESRIRVEVEEAIRRLRGFAGRQFDPRDVLSRCFLNVLASVILGQRYQYDDPSLAEFMNAIRRRMTAHIPELEVCSLLRFVPRFRQRMKAMSFGSTELKSIAEREVNISFVITACKIIICDK